MELRRPALLVDSDGRECDILILDISGDGFRFEASDPPRIGEEVTLRVERSQEFAAQILWVLGNEGGGRFLTPASLSEWTDS